jgi:hypothetical protein
LVDASNRVKPALTYFLEFARELKALATPPAPVASTVALYWPREYYLRDNPRNPGNEPGVLSRQLAIAHFVLSETGAEPRIVRDTTTLTSTDTLVIAGAKLTASETTALSDWVRRGGRLVWHGPDALTWGAGLGSLLGAEPLDFRAPHPRQIDWLGTNWNFTLFPREIFLKVRLTNAHPLASDDRGDPFLFRHSLGQGCVVTCLADVDREFAATSNRREGRDRWTQWYRGMLSAGQ